MTAYDMPALPVVDTRDAHRRSLISVSDDLLDQLERLNLATYAPTDHSPRAKCVPVPAELSSAVNQLRVEAGLLAGPLANTTDALDALFEVQQALFNPLGANLATEADDEIEEVTS
jgi:hypothetical protein